MSRNVGDPQGLRVAPRQLPARKQGHTQSYSCKILILTFTNKDELKVGFPPGPPGEYSFFPTPSF